MKDQIISFETAKLAKEKGFNEACLECYIPEGTLYNNNGEGVHFTNEQLLTFNYSAPTQSLLQKWLREVHRIDIYCYPNYDKKGVTFQVNLYTDPYVKFKDTNHFYKGGYKTYEQALEVGLQEALKLIS